MLKSANACPFLSRPVGAGKATVASRLLAPTTLALLARPAPSLVAYRAGAVAARGSYVILAGLTSLLGPWLLVRESSRPMLLPACYLQALPFLVPQLRWVSLRRRVSMLGLALLALTLWQRGALARRVTMGPLLMDSSCPLDLIVRLGAYRALSMALVVCEATDRLVSALNEVLMACLLLNRRWSVAMALGSAVVDSLLGAGAGTMSVAMSMFVDSTFRLARTSGARTCAPTRLPFPAGRPPAS